MPVGYRSNGVDFDSLFDPDVMGDGPTVAAPGMRSGGTPLRYAAIGYGSKRANVGYRSPNGQDVSNLWAAAGTAQYQIPGLQGKLLSASSTGLSGQQGTLTASVGVLISSGGEWSVSGANTQGPVVQPAPTSGTWLPSGRSANEYDVRIRTTTGGGPSTVNNNAGSYAQASTRTSSASISVQRNAGPPTGTTSASITFLIDVRNRASGSVSTTTLSGSVAVASQV